MIQTAENPFVCWQAAYTLGKTLDPGSLVAVAKLIQLIDTLHNEALHLQVIESLGKIAPDHPIVIPALEAMLQSTQQDSIRRRTAYSLGKIAPDHPRAISTLEQIISSTPDAILRLRTAENLSMLNPENTIAAAALECLQKKSERTSQRHRNKTTREPDLNQIISTLEQRLATAKDTANQRRIAYRLATLQPGHPEAIGCLLRLLSCQGSPTLYKRVVEDLETVLLHQQLTEIVAHLKGCVADSDLTIAALNNSVQLHECYKLLWYCAQQCHTLSSPTPGASDQD